MTTTQTTTSRQFRYTYRHRADDVAGEIHYTITDTLTARADGLLVVTRTVGHAEGAPVDERSSRGAPGVTMAAAAAYRLSRAQTPQQRQVRLRPAPGGMMPGLPAPWIGPPSGAFMSQPASYDVTPPST